MIGRTTSHYTILEKLGGGAMGVVYKAKDLKLERLVALKFLPPELTGNPESKARFIQEAHAASALDHPNICTIHYIEDTDDGQMFMVMAYYEGETLKRKIQRGPLRLQEALDIAIQTAHGLAKAHQRGIVHRDIKPANLMITKDGVVKIVDFGLAKLAWGKDLSGSGTIMGTVDYMSPEQAQGETVDRRTDIWSLGAVLYEMVTGQRPFKGDNPQAVIYSVLNATPRPMAALRTDLPMGLELVVNKTLDKNPVSRYQLAQDILLDLKKLKKGLKPKKAQSAKDEPQPSIAVLPFANLSADPDQEYFCDGMAEEIINALTQVEGLRVVARTSAFAFRGKKVDIREIGRKLNVETLVEGSVQRAGNRVRVTTQLVNVADGYHLWSAKYDREMEDVFAIQDEISLAIVGKLKVKLLGKEKARLMKHHTLDLDAYHLYLKGRFFWNKRTEKGLKKGVEYFEHAIQKDPNYALAYTGVADSYNILGFYSVLRPKEAFPRAKTAAKKALEIDETIAEAHTSLAFAQLFYDWNWSAAEREFHHAFQLNPGYATAHHWYAEYLSFMGRLDEAIAEAKRALGFGPLTLIINALTSWVFYYARQYDQAIRQSQKTLELDREFVPAIFWLGLAYEQKGLFEKAEAQLHKAISLSERSPLILAALGGLYAAWGKRGEAQNVLEELKQTSDHVYVTPYYISAICAGLGDKDQAFEWLEKAYRERDNWLVYLKIDPIWDGVRADSRFTALLKKVGLEK
jgi:TolB-like protein/tetratricopeptide (TPR) repeat protein